MSASTTTTNPITFVGGCIEKAVVACCYGFLEFFYGASALLFAMNRKMNAWLLFIFVFAYIGAKACIRELDSYLPEYGAFTYFAMLYRTIADLIMAPALVFSIICLISICTPIRIGKTSRDG